MNKKQWMIPLSFSLLVGLTGCTNDNNRAGGNGNNLTRPMGYYSNENHAKNDYGLLRDNDGAMTEIMDHNLGVEDQTINEKTRRQMQIRDENGNPQNPTVPRAKTDRNFFQRDNRFSTSDLNYHGHLSAKNGNAGVVTNPDFQDRITAKIRNKVENIDNVRNVRSVAYGNNVIVSVSVHDHDRATETKRAIKNAVKPYTKGKTVQVLIDEGTMGRDRNIHNDSQREKGGS
ncbi:YhcN/YlaJ family sporulation lipoprotein [Neobacillus cucumis]|uniref:Spore cortex protein CoxA n=1 Tax=Neobacillus cucumis TaxID=1740721 RepID=A0A2N5H6Y0_9BACI|nr:YhcN/YlaJ family sporulation lipoprotein [Neobacillus cucumis]PLS01280.1 spore cortex protein CoxA [Neobacillus cucumis]